jgi:hypothetical protein
MESIFISILLAAFAYLDGLRTKKQLLAAIDSTYVDRIDAAINDLQTQDQQLLKVIQQELIQKGQLDLAEKMNIILSDKFKISSASFIILKAYLNSDQLYKTAMNSDLLSE